MIKLPRVAVSSVLIVVIVLSTFLVSFSIFESGVASPGVQINEGKDIVPVSDVNYFMNAYTVLQISKSYHSTHTYRLEDDFVCGDMSIDIWDMIKTQGINANLVLGNVDENITSIQKSNHVWVVAEIAPDKWIAVEPTGGFLVCEDEYICTVNNSRYYSGWRFENPKELKSTLNGFNQLVWSIAMIFGITIVVICTILLIRFQNRDR